MKRVINTERLASCDLSALQAALTKIGAAARIANNNRQPWGGSSTIHVEDEDGWNITGVALIEETLSDGSKVYNAQLLFSELSEPFKTQAAATARAARRKRRPANPIVRPTKEKPSEETPCQS